MRFNKGSASLNKFDPLPKIEEAAPQTKEESDPTSLPSQQIPVSEKKEKGVENEAADGVEES